ncbi:MAG TPA: sulfite exporter TauE/SafE family protein [Candidatus Limnocylindrales bacterium]
MTPFEAGAILSAGLAAGTINAIVGSGSLITFPLLLAFGFRPLDANVSNTVGLVPGSLSGAIGYRHELAGQRSRAIRLGVVAGAGGLTGGVLLLAFPGAFAAIVPVLIFVALVLVAAGPRLSKALAQHRHAEAHKSWPLALTMFGSAVYGGYFGAGQGIIMIALLTIFLPDGLQRLNGLKNALAVIVNGVAAILFILVAPVHWDVALLIAVGSIAGGQVGARVGRRLPAPLLRLAIICVGVLAEVRLLAG